jgi:CheY-like chemotaxis protein
MRVVPDKPDLAARTRDMMERQLTHLVRLVDDLLDMARISRGKIELRKERADLGNIITSAVEASRPLIEGNRHALSVHLPGEALRLNVDPTRIAQVVSNLLNNAAKYTPTGGRIELKVWHNAGEAVIQVSDTGVGLSTEALSIVFDMFTQVRGTSDRALGGLGIGLALVRSLVEMHGGAVAVTSPGPGKGSTFTIRLPLAADIQTDIGVPTQHTGDNSGHSKRMRTLVVDDNKDAAMLLAELLGTIGNETRIAHDGYEALKVAQDFRPDVVFLDIGMPGMDGYQVARLLRKMPDMKQVKLIALTGWGAESDRAHSDEAGFNFHLTKPADLASVEKALSAFA